MADSHSSRLLAIASVAAFGVATGASAQEALPSIAPIETMISAIENGEREQAVALISSVQSLSSEPRLVKTGGQFFDRLNGCKASIGNRRSFGGNDYVLLEVKWACADGEYETIVGREENKPYVEIAEFSDPARIARNAAERAANNGRLRPMAPPMRIDMPPRAGDTSPEAEAKRAAIAAKKARQSEILDALGNAVRAGDLSAVAEHISADARFTYGWRDPFNSAYIIELDDEGVAAGNAQIKHGMDTMGAPSAVNCEMGVIEICRWDYAAPGQSMFAFVMFRGEQISGMNLTYTTTETISKAYQRATPEQREEFAAKMAQRNR